MTLSIHAKTQILQAANAVCKLDMDLIFVSGSKFSFVFILSSLEKGRLLMTHKENDLRA